MFFQIFSVKGGHDLSFGTYTVVYAAEEVQQVEEDKVTKDQVDVDKAFKNEIDEIEATLRTR